MRNGLKYVTFDTDMGWSGLLASDKGLLAVVLPCKTEDEAERMLGVRIKEAALVPDYFAGTVEHLRAYFHGERVEFPEKLDLSAVTPFRRAVWEATREIPYGETRSYLWVARQIGKPEAPRAVGQAMGRNPVPVIVPCHRVVASDGSLGGFTGGLDLKKQLLKLEGMSTKNI